MSLDRRRAGHPGQENAMEMLQATERSRSGAKPRAQKPSKVWWHMTSESDKTSDTTPSSSKRTSQSEVHSSSTSITSTTSEHHELSRYLSKSVSDAASSFRRRCTKAQDKIFEEAYAAMTLDVSPDLPLLLSDFSINTIATDAGLSEDTRILLKLRATPSSTQLSRSRSTCSIQQIAPEVESKTSCEFAPDLVGSYYRECTTPYQSSQRRIPPKEASVAYFGSYDPTRTLSLHSLHRRGRGHLRAGDVKDTFEKNPSVSVRPTLHPGYKSKQVRLELPNSRQKASAREPQHSLPRHSLVAPTPLRSKSVDAKMTQHTFTIRPQLPPPVVVAEEQCFPTAEQDEIDDAPTALLPAKKDRRNRNMNITAPPAAKVMVKTVLPSSDSAASRERKAMGTKPEVRIPTGAPMRYLYNSAVARENEGRSDDHDRGQVSCSYRPLQ